MKFELKDLIMIGGLVVSLTAAFITLKLTTEGLEGSHNKLEKRVEKLEQLELSALSARVDRLSCRIGQLRRKLENQPINECPE